MSRIVLAFVAAGALVVGATANATPSTVFWTPATNYVQPYLVPHVTYDTYFAEAGAYPVITGLQMGVLPFEKLQAEVGFDIAYPGRGSAVLQLNGKLGVPEGAYTSWQPGISGGIMCAGVKKHVSTYDLLHAEIGKTVPHLGVVTVGAYYGIDDVLFADEAGSVHRVGLIASYVTPDWNVKVPALTKVNAFADVQTGDNAFGAIGAGIGLYFTPAVDLLAGPVFFLNDKVQPGGARWMWSMQLDVDLDIVKKALGVGK